MKKYVIVGLVFLAAAYIISCQHDDPTLANLDGPLENALNDKSSSGSYKGYILPESNDLANLPNQDPKNPLTPEKVELGRLLFYETGLGLENKKSPSKTTYSCSSCHVPVMGFTAGRFQGIADGAIGFGHRGEGRAINPLYTGDEVDAQGARPLPVINTAFVTNALWAGSFGSFNSNEGTQSVWHQDTLIEVNFQGLMGLEANNERALAVHRQVINKAVMDSLGYTQMFDAAFPGIPQKDRYNRRTGAFAIAAYFRTILTNKAPFQRWLKGERTAMSAQEKKGATLFFGKAGCVNCHNSPSLNALPHKFVALGVKNMYQSKYTVFRTGPKDRRNLGRGGFTYKEEDMHKFKVPQLYNLRDVGFYFHGASKTSLRDVVEYFNAAIPENPEVPLSSISTNFHPLNLSKEEVDDLTEFLENALFDPNLERYAPVKTKSGYCFPNNDKQSKIDLGCN
jgi:cytochrome c peroxidase